MYSCGQGTPAVAPEGQYELAGHATQEVLGRVMYPVAHTQLEALVDPAGEIALAGQAVARPEAQYELAGQDEQAEAAPAE